MTTSRFCSPLILSSFLKSGSSIPRSLQSQNTTRHRLSGTACSLLTGRVTIQTTGTSNPDQPVTKSSSVRGALARKRKSKVEGNCWISYRIKLRTMSCAVPCCRGGLSFSCRRRKRDWFWEMQGRKSRENRDTVAASPLRTASDQ